MFYGEAAAVNIYKLCLKLKNSLGFNLIDFLLNLLKCKKILFKKIIFFPKFNLFSLIIKIFFAKCPKHQKNMKKS